MAELLREPSRAAPIEVAVFRKTRGGEGPLRVGDEFVVRMPGPWDGPVVVADRTPTSFRFATLRGHLEAGQIEFRTSADGDGAVRFEIESWARRRRPPVEPAVRPGQAGQGDAAAHVDPLLRAGGQAGRGPHPGGVHIDTRRVEVEAARGR